MEPIQVNLPEDFDKAIKEAIKKYIKGYTNVLQSIAVWKLLDSVNFRTNDICKANILIYMDTEKALRFIVGSVIDGIFKNQEIFKKAYESNINITACINSTIYFECNSACINTMITYSSNCFYVVHEDSDKQIPLSKVYFENNRSKKIQLIKGVIKCLQKDINKNYMYTKSNKDDIFDNFHKASHILSYSDLCDSYVLRKFRCILKEYLNLLSKYENDEEMLAKIEEEFKKSNIILKFNPEVTRLDATFKYDKDNKPSEITCTVYAE